MAVTVYDVLRAVVLGDGSRLNDAGWQADALAAVNERERDELFPASVPAATPAPAAQVPLPTDPDQED